MKGKAAVLKKNQALGELRIEYVTLDKVRPNTYNPNRQSEHDLQLLLKSIGEDGFTQPVVVAEDYTIVDGEHRWRAAAHLGMTTIPVVIVPMDVTQARIATLRHNRARGSEDISMATAVLRDLEKLGALEWAQDSLQISDDELNRLLADIPAPEALMGQEFGTAWIPQTQPAAWNQDVHLSANGQVMAHSTPAAIEQARKQEVALMAARTDEERLAVKRDNRIYRVTLVFSDDEADTVKMILGDMPAPNLLELCQQERARRES